MNEVEVDGLGTSYNLIFKKDTLKITPELKFTQDSLSLDRYGYEWIVVSEQYVVSVKVDATH
ncbi:MAG: hypothetical protein V8R91_03995, partial [Butyricimonas faecihominis]